MDLYASVIGLIMVHCIFGIPITALLFRGDYTGIPNELLSTAASTDGCGFFGVYRYIPADLDAGLCGRAARQFTSIWNDYLIGLVVLGNPRLAPINVAVQNITALPPNGMCRWRWP